MDVQIVGALISDLAAITAVIVSVIAKRLFAVKVGGLEISFERDYKPTADLEKDSRLSEARELLQRQESNAKWNNRAAGSLVFGQYVVGGVLATSFCSTVIVNSSCWIAGCISSYLLTYTSDLSPRCPVSWRA